jgi:hypothetical protein
MTAAGKYFMFRDVVASLSYDLRKSFWTHLRGRNVIGCRFDAAC